MNNDDITQLDNKLEGVLSKYLQCGSNDFGVKANYNLIKNDWKSPINFALGHKYAMSNNDSSLKSRIEYFLGDSLLGENISDIIQNYEHYALESKEEAYKYIKELEEILDL